MIIDIADSAYSRWLSTIASNTVCTSVSDRLMMPSTSAMVGVLATIGKFHGSPPHGSEFAILHLWHPYTRGTLWP